MRICERLGCENNLDDKRAHARYCSSTCRREAARARNFSRPEPSQKFDWTRYVRIRRPSRHKRAGVTSGLILCLLLILAGCGGGGTTTKTVHVAPPLTIAGHPCAKSDYAMQCALAQLPPPKLALPNKSGPSLYGVDFAWGGPRSCAAMRAIGAHFAWSYWSYDTSGKNWTAGLVNAFHACGIATVGGWETSANRATQGFGAGVSDAREAARQARADGNTDGAITFAVDCDCSGPSILAYFQGVHSVLGARDDAYGGYFQVLYLFQHGVVGHLNFQTYAWSGGRWLPASIAPLEQYLNGNSFDNDRAIAANYGQFPPPAPPGPSSAQLARWRGARDTSARVYRRQKCTMPVLGPKGCGQLAWRVLHYQRLLDKTQTHPVCWGKHAQFAAAACQIIRPEVSIQSRARGATDLAIQSAGCNGPVSFPHPTGPKALCNKLRQRRGYFDREVQAEFKEFR